LVSLTSPSLNSIFKLRFVLPNGCLIVLNIPSFSDDLAVRTNQPLISVVLNRRVDIRVEKYLRLFGMGL
jgi:hypothetical protein